MFLAFTLSCMVKSDDVMAATWRHRTRGNSYEVQKLASSYATAERGVLLQIQGNILY